MCVRGHMPPLSIPPPSQVLICLVILQCFPSPNYQCRPYAPPLHTTLCTTALYICGQSATKNERKIALNNSRQEVVLIYKLLYFIYFRDLCEFSSCVKKYPDNATKCKYILELLYLHNQIQNKNHNNNTVTSLSEHLKVMNVSEYIFSVPISGPQLVYQRPWYVLFCLWKSAFKRSLAAYRKE